MGALFGFVGPRDPQLLRSMGQQLLHRGDGSLAKVATDEATLAYAPNSLDPPDSWSGAGLATDGQRTLALCGYLTGAEHARPAPAQLLSAYTREGTGAIERLRGAFVVAVVDGPIVHLVRDGCGVRTIYYASHDAHQLFAIEPKAVLVAPGFARRVRPAAIAQYLTFSFIPGSDTMLEGVHELPAGHRVTLQRGAAPHTRRHFFFERSDVPSVSSHDLRTDTEWVEAFRGLHAQAVRERTPPGEPLGVFLSGGIDSSIVTAELARQQHRPVRSYAIHFGPEYPHELDYARAVARQARTQHEDVLIQPRSFIPRLRRFLWHLDEPIGDPVALPNFELAAHVSKDVRWVFNGEGGDPIFGGPKNLSMLLHHWYGGPERPARWRERAYLASYRRCYEELGRLLTPEAQGAFSVEHDLEAQLTPHFEAAEPKSMLDKLMAINLRLKGAHLILPKVERMTAAFGITHAAPLFDERIVQLSFQMPARLKVQRGIEKIVLKRAYQQEVPEAVLNRPKSGMRVPVHYWFQKEMRRYARSILSPRAVRRAGIFRPERVKELLDYNIREGAGRYGLRLWMLITFEIWRRIVVEGEPV